MPVLPFSEWLPDQPDFANKGSTNILNVYPRTPQSYGPIASFSSAGLSALDARCRGGGGFRDSASNSYNFAGTASKLWKAISAGSAWADASKATGYNCATEEQWRFAQLGDSLFASNISDPIQVFTLNSSSTFADLSSAAPNARYVCTSRNFLLAANTTGGTADATVPGSRPQRVWWSAIGDPTNWPTLQTSAAAAVQSDAQDVTGDGWITGIVPSVGSVDVLVFFEKSVTRCMYIGAPDIWGFYPMYGVRGCTVPGSIQRTEIGAIYLGPDDFYLNDGQNVLGIANQKCAKTFYADIDQTYLSRCCSALDPINKLYYFAYPSLSTGNGVLDKILVCNYSLKSLAGTPGRWAPITPGTFEFLLIATSFGFNVDNFTSGTGFTVDSAPAGPDSRLWTGNKDILSAIDTTHMLNYFAGNNLAPTLETSEAQFIPGKRAAITNSKPLIDGGTPTATPYTRNRLQDAIVARTASTMNTTGYCPFKDAEGFYHRIRVTLPANSLFTHAQGMDIPDDALIDTGSR